MTASTDDASSIALTTDDSTETCSALAKGECQTSSTCEWKETTSTCFAATTDDQTADDASSVALATDDSTDSCSALAKGECQTSSACEWKETNSTCFAATTDDQ